MPDIIFIGLGSSTMKSPVSSPAPDFDHPLEMLAACHDRIEDRLDVLQRLLTHLPEHGGDLAKLQFKNDVHEGNLWVHQIKGRNPSRVCIPLELRLNLLGLSVADVVRRCRENVVLSPYLIHHVSHGVNFKPGDPVFHGTIAKAFAKARDVSGLKWPGKNPPSFHELRSLAERLYKDQGGIDTRVLLGHKHERTTALYHDARGAEWMVVKLA